MSTSHSACWSCSRHLARLFLLVAFACGAKQGSQLRPAADLVLTGGTIYTMDPLKPRAEAIAILGGQIESVGSAADIGRLIGTHTRVIDLGGGAATPGLVDAHCHLYGLGHALESLQLRGFKSAAVAAQLVKAASKNRAPGEWIVGRGWDQNLFADKNFPTRHILDGAAPNHPVALRRIDGHALWANSAAMRIAGVTTKTQAPAGGKILRDKKGEPTGVFIDAAIALVERKIPTDSRQVIARKIIKGQRAALAAGLSGVHEMGISDKVVSVYRELVRQKQLKLRVYALLSGGIDSLPDREPNIDTDGTAMFVLRAVKLYADGALGSRGAALLLPYTDDANNSGLVQASVEELTHAARVSAETGFQLAVHAIGDRANRNVLDAYATVSSTGDDKLRFRIEHAQILTKEDIPRFARLGVIASMQPTHATSDMPWAEARVGKERIQGAYAWRSLLDAGARIAGGSDFPVEEVSPMLGLYAAVSRQDASGLPAGGWFAKQRVSLDEAIHMFTVEPAHASFVEKRRGRIAPGFVADLTVFARDLRADRSLLETSAELVIVGGEIVFARVAK